MSLPILTCPTSECTLPVSKAVVEYRPFIVKEQKIMLLAASSKGANAAKEVIQSIAQVIELCTFNKVKVEKLSSIDFEYLFIKIKSASSGSTVEQNYKCNRVVIDEETKEESKCGHSTAILINHDDIKLDEELPDNKLEVSENLIVIVNPPTIDIVNTMTNSGKTETDELEVMAQCVDMIVMGEDVHSTFTTAEMVEFLGQFTETQITPLVEYFKALPKLTYHSEFTCKKCKFNHEIDIRGIENFFG